MPLAYLGISAGIADTPELLGSPYAAMDWPLLYIGAALLGGPDRELGPGAACA